MSLPLPGAKPSDQIRPDDKCKACEPPVRFNGVPVDVLSAATGIKRLTYNVPGLLGDLIGWNLATARRPSRIMALASALAVVGKLLDRKVAGPTMSATHLYTVVLAPTGSGKGHQIDVVKRALKSAGMGNVIGPDDFASVQAVQNEIVEKPSLICVMDEFGSVLRRIKDGLGNVSEMTGEMRKLWDAWRPYNSIKKANKDSVAVESPALAILALATPTDFYSALVVEDVSNGFLNRFLILEEQGRPFEQDPKSWVNDVPFELMEEIHRVCSYAMGRTTQPTIDGKPSVVLRWGPGAKAVYDEFGKVVLSETDDRILQLRIRAPEMAVRLATIRAGGRRSATVDKHDMLWGRDLAVASADMLVAGVQEHMVPQGLDGLCEKITDYLSRHGGKASLRDVCRSVRRGVKRNSDLADAIKYLEVEERIEVKPPRDGRSGQVLHLLKD